MKKKISIKLKNNPNNSHIDSKAESISKNINFKVESDFKDQSNCLLKKIDRRFLNPILNLIENEGLDENGNCLLTVDGLYIIKEVLNHIVDLNSTSNIKDILASFIEEEVEEVEEVFEELENYEEDENEEDEDEEDEDEEIHSSNDYDVEELNDELDELDNYVVDSDDDFYE